MMELEEFRIVLDPDTLQADTLHIKDIVISKPNIRYERKITTDNIKALRQEIDRAMNRRVTEMGEGESNTVAEAEAEQA